MRSSACAVATVRRRSRRAEPAALESRCGFTQVLLPGLFLEVVLVPLFLDAGLMVPAERELCELVNFHRSVNSALPVMCLEEDALCS